jgi:hypothetical protein
MFAFSLPPELKLTPIFEERVRFERRTDQDLSRTNRDNRSQLLNRERIGFNAKYSDRWTGEFRFQYSHNTIWDAKSNFSDEGRNLYLGHVDYQLEPGVRLSVGRQIIRAGRLFDSAEFGQRNRTFDLIRYQSPKADLFIGRVGTNIDLHDHSKVAGGFLTSKLGRTLGFWKRNDQSADISSFTVGQSYATKSQQVTYQFEGAYQFGHRKGQDINAFFLQGRATRNVGTGTDAYIESNIASGGGNSEQYRTFDPLYYDAHGPLGLADIQSLSNVRQIEVGVTRRISPKFTGRVSFNNYALYDGSDSWYGLAGNPNKRPGGTYTDPTGQRGRDIGNETNIALTYLSDKHSTVILELGLFRPGKFIRSFQNNATKDETWLGLTYAYRY